MSEASRTPAAPTLHEIHAEHSVQVRAHYDDIASKLEQFRRRNAYYHGEIDRYYQFLVLPGSSVLEIGCGTADTLAALRPARGVGIDLSEKMIAIARRRHPAFEFVSGDFELLDLEGTFDYIIVSGTLHVVDDIQLFLAKIAQLCGPTTRVIVDTYNPIWRSALGFAEKLGIKMPELLQNWLSKTDLRNLFEISGFDVIRTHDRLLVPVGIPVFFWPFSGLCLSRFLIARVPQPPAVGRVTCSVVITCRDELANIEPLIQRTAVLGSDAQIIFSEGHSKDGTREEIQRCMAAYPHRNIQLVIQDGIGQGDAMRKGFKHATGDLILWLEADLTTPPEEILKLYGVLAEGKGEFVNGSRLVYPMPTGSMRFLNLWGNRFFGRLFTWLLGQQFRDTLCGLKGLTRIGYEKIVAEKGYFGDFDPFGDFEILFGASKRNLRIVEVPVHYRPRVYGTTKISRFRDGLLLLRMSWLALWRLKLY
jgi:ubiquinone/menaquinone biosynthesis C-methylase UbiE